MSPGAASHRGPGTVPVQQTQQASSPHAPAGSAGGEGESSSAPPGYAEFVTSAVRSAMEPFLQNVQSGSDFATAFFMCFGVPKIDPLKSEKI